MPGHRKLVSIILLLSLLDFSILAISTIPPVRGLNFSAAQQVPMGTTLSPDSMLKFPDVAPSNATALKSDVHIRYLDQNSNNHWIPGDPVAYDFDSDNVSRSVDPVIAGTLPTGSQLKFDPLIKYVDISNSNLWQTGDAIVYDTNNNNLYTVGKPVIAGTPVPTGTPLTPDNHIKYVGSGSTWIPGNSVTYDSNSSGVYSASLDGHIRFVDSGNIGHWIPNDSVVYHYNLSSTHYASGDLVLYGQTPPVGTTLSLDPKMKFVDANRSGVWDQGEAVVYDSNGNGLVDPGELIIVAASPRILSLLNPDLRVKFVDTNGNGIWDSGEPVVYDTVGRGFFNATIDPLIKYFDANGNGVYDSGIDSVIYDKTNAGVYKTGDPIIAGPTPPSLDATLISEIHFRFVDTNLGGRWISGDPVVYDTNLDNIYETGEPVISSSPLPINGTLLREPVISCTPPAVSCTVPAIGTALKIDLKLKYVETGGDNVWNTGEAVAYDTNSNNGYDAGDILIIGAWPAPGTLLSGPVIAGTTPALGTILKSDAKFSFIDANGTGVWNPGETVIYDSNGDGDVVYDQNDSVVSNGAPGRGLWINGEVVVYDSLGTSIYRPAEPVVYGTAPLNGTRVGRDPLVKFVDANSNGHWDPGETVVYDANNNGIYDPGDIVIAGLTPGLTFFQWPSLSQDTASRTWLAWNEVPAGFTKKPVVYLKTWNGTAWSPKQAVTSGSSTDNQNFITALSNRTMMILWSSNQTGHPQIFYRLYSTASNPTPTIGPIQLTFTTSTNDQYPSAVQDRNGRIWVVWARQTSQQLQSQIYYKYFNGSSWSSDFLLPPASATSYLQSSPSVSQTKDGKIRVVFTSNAQIDIHLNSTMTDDTLPSLPSTGIPAASWSSNGPFPFSLSGVDDDRPALVQARDGSLWLFFQRTNLDGTQYIDMATSPDGVTWSNPPTTLTTTGQDFQPTAAQISSDHKIWIFWNRANAGTVQVWSASSDPITGIADVGVQILAATPRLTRAGLSTNITVNVLNYGDFPESTTLTLRANSTTLKLTSLSLAPGQILPLSFNWTNAGPWGRYTLTATISQIPNENAINQGDNSMSFYPLRVAAPGDANIDGTVNLFDLALVDFCIGKPIVPGTLCGPNVDVNPDGMINLFDLATVDFYFGKSV